MAIRYGMSVAREAGFGALEVEMDNLVLAQALQSHQSPGSDIGLLLEDIWFQ